MLLFSHKLVGVIMCAMFVSVGSFSYAAEYFKWTDDKGDIHISDSLSNVPAKYRNQIESKTFENSDSELSSEPAPGTTPAPQNPRIKNHFVKQPPAEAEKEAKKPKRYEVPYTPYEKSPGGSSKRVIVSVVLNGSVTAPLAIDTGAPGTVISFSLAKKLGLFAEDQGRLVTQAGGIGGTTPAIHSIIDTVQVGGAKSVFVPTTIIKSMSKAFDGLLGMDFVGNYSMTIDSKRKMVIFEELSTDEEHPGGHDQEWWSSLFKDYASSRDAWRAYSEKLEKKIHDSMTTEGNEDIDRKIFADYQCREADKLLDKLSRYARENNVPIHWRK